MNIEERRVTVELTEVLEDFCLDEGDPGKYTKIGRSMEEETKQDLV